MVRRTTGYEHAAADSIGDEALARPQGIRRVLWTTLERWLDHGAPTRAAAIAFYTITSLAPLSVLLVWIGASAWERGAVRSRMLGWLSESVGPEATALVGMVLTDASLPSGDALVPTTIAALLFVFSATAVFSQLQGALRDVWGETSGSGGRVVGFLKHRLVALLLVGALGVALGLSMGLSVMVSSVAEALGTTTPSLLLLGDLVVSTITLVVLFTLVFRILPAARVRWRQAWLGGVVTGVLHIAGQEVAGAYLRGAAVGSAWGAAGSLVVFLFWVYFSSLVFLYGAEVTHALSRPSGD